MKPSVNLSPSWVPNLRVIPSSGFISLDWDGDFIPVQTTTTMTKHHFIRLADFIREDGTFTDRQLDTLRRFCLEQNPKFNPMRWLSYIRGTCGPNGGKK